jgi:hypothetical protein
MVTKNISLNSALSEFPDVIQKELRDALSKGAVIPSELALSWLKKLDIEIDSLMIELLPIAKSIRPCTNFKILCWCLSLMLGSRQRRASKEVSSFLFGKRQSL